MVIELARMKRMQLLTSQGVALAEKSDIVPVFINNETMCLEMALDNQRLPRVRYTRTHHGLFLKGPWQRAHAQ